MLINLVMRVFPSVYQMFTLYTSNILQFYLKNIYIYYSFVNYTLKKKKKGREEGREEGKKEERKGRELVKTCS